MPQSEHDRLLRSAWQARNELYCDLFGGYARAFPRGYNTPSTPDPEIVVTEGRHEFSSTMHKQEIPVLAYAPDEVRRHWLYVTSGLSNPWFQEMPDDVSGFGCELAIKSRQPSRWAIRILQRLSQYILSFSGTLSPGVILDIEQAIPGFAGSEIKNIMIWYADEAQDCWYQLPSGGFGIFCAIGISEDECVYAESVDQYGVWCIQQVLRNTGVGQITDPRRPSVMKQDGISTMLSSIRLYAENFRELC